MTLSVPRTVGPNLPAQIDDRALQFRREHFHVAAFHAHRGAERFETFQVQIDRPIADDATSRQRNRRFLAAPEQRAEHANRRAHFSHDVVGRDRFDRVGRDGDGAAGAFHLRAEMHQDLQHVMRVAQVGDAMEDARLAREQRRGEDRQRGVFRAADLDRTGKRPAAVNQNFIHTCRRGIVSLRHNRVSKRCRDNFFGHQGRQIVGLPETDFEREQTRRTQMNDGAASINLRTISSPRSPPKSAISGSCRTSRESVARSLDRDVRKVGDDQIEYVIHV